MKNILAGFMCVLPLFSGLGVADSSDTISGSEHIKADRILVEKSKRKLTLLREEKVLRMYRIALGKNPIGPKVLQGDRKTPEGMYLIDYRNGESDYHLSLHISYPNASDVQRAKELGFSPGGDIMIHGIKKGFGWLGLLHRFFDWTDGCIGVTNSEIEEIWHLVTDGTPVEIRP